MCWMLAAGFLLAACSDSLEETAGNGTGSGGFNGEKGYVNIGLKLPTVSGTPTRSGAGNTNSNYKEDFEDGTQDEYKVSSVIVALFYGNSEADAICKSAFKMDAKDFASNPGASPSDGNVTTYYTTGVRMIDAPQSGQQVYALALVNANSSQFSLSEGTTASTAAEGASTAVLPTKLKVNGSEFTSTLSQLQAITETTELSTVKGDDGFFMSNAPIAKVATNTYSSSGISGQAVTTLASITVYDSEAKAEAAPNPVYVERAVAKVEVKVGSNNGSTSLTIDSKKTGNVYGGATVDFKGWLLQNTNKSYYPVRVVTAPSTGGGGKTNGVDGWSEWNKYVPSGSTVGSNNRFFGTTANPFRTYWGIDPNYKKVNENLSNEFHIIEQKNAASLTWNTVGTTGGTKSTESKLYQYCLENTSDVTAMMDNQLTSVLLKATFTLPEGGSTAATTAEQAKSFLMLNNTSAIYTEEKFVQWATAVLNSSKETGVALGDSTLVFSSTLDAGKTITTTDDVKKLLKVSSTQRNNNPKELCEVKAKAILKAAGNNIKYYQNGVTYYYAAVIKHFGDVETPLGNKAIDKIENYTKADHLGRYGVLRNNWYEITINSVSGPGEPEIPEIPTDPADKTKSYINAEINVLSWAKRTQGVDL